MSSDTLLFKRSEVASPLGIGECMDAVEHAFKMLSVGEAAAPGILGIHATDGGFHIKAGILNLQQPYFIAKINANYPMNPKRHGLPTIQGVITVAHAIRNRHATVFQSIFKLPYLTLGGCYIYINHSNGLVSFWIGRADALPTFNAL